MTKSLLVARMYTYLNEPQLAQRSYEEAKLLLESEVKKSPEDPLLHSSLGIVYAALGRKEEAIREGKQGVALLPVSQNAFYGLYAEEEIAAIYAILGENDLALDQIEYLLSIPSWVTIPYIQLNPRFSSLMEHPRFKVLVEKYGTFD